MTTRTLDVRLREDLGEPPETMAEARAARMLNPDPREVKLPQWTRNLLQTLRAEVRTGHNELQAMKHAVGETNVWISGGPTLEDLPLPKNSKIRFRINKDDEIVVGIDYFSATHLEVHGWGRNLAVEPQAANTFRVRIVE